VGRREPVAEFLIRGGINAQAQALGLALVVIGAVSAVIATSASANYNIASATGGTISGSQVTTNEFFTDVGTVKCTTATFSASQATETAETLTILPAYSGCTLAGVKVDVHMNKCHILATKTTTTGIPYINTTHAIGHVKCPTKGLGPTNREDPYISITDTSGLNCDVKVAEQETEGTIMMTNEAAGTVVVESNVEGIAYSWRAGCPNAGGKVGSNTNGKYTGSVRLAGKNSGGTAVAVKAT
jgi:hypothetical protein